MTVPGPVVGVVGASVRAAAVSLARAGYPAWGVDLFADRDLVRVAPAACCPVGDYPHGLPGLADRFPPGPVVYTGGLENHPDVVAALAARRLLWGNPPAVLETARDPRFPARVWPRTDLPLLCPRVLPGCATPPSGTWLLKPRRSAGGYGIVPYHPADPPRAPETHYLQEFVPGTPVSALFCAVGGDAPLLGITEQLVGEPWLHARRFHYAGNVGPIDLPHRVRFSVEEFGRRAAAEAGLVGLFGIDFLLAAGAAYPVEINPRYTASAEVLEFATGRAVMSDHAVGCGGPPGRRPAAGNATGPVVGKAVYYAPRPIAFPATGPWDDRGRPFDPWVLPAHADIPAAGAAIEPGWPVLTVFASGSTPAEVRGRLQSRAADLDRLFATAEGRA
ncbi:MAG TPA: ATP-grasp domain-containing protein [Urbifossiella sp.]|jgi:predicted ATP-grasp superfamily ATP-dependent carboligase|nr:ATP-grasp domain-containing protein [Urbifossiella sp.]